MPSPSRKADWPIIAGVILALVAVGMGVYVWGYFALSEFGEMPEISLINKEHVMVFHPARTGRVFNEKWQRKLFAPAARVESWVRGGEVYLEP